MLLLRGATRSYSSSDRCRCLHAWIAPGPRFTKATCFGFAMGPFLNMMLPRIEMNRRLAMPGERFEI
jgi:hypothetical protein